MDTEELKYEPVPPNFYNYNAKQHLINNIDYCLESNTFTQIKIVAYEVKNDGVYPFLQFLLLKDDILDNLTLPVIPLNYSNTSTEQIINMTTILFVGLHLTKNYETFTKNIVFDGFYECNGEMFLFVDITKNSVNLYDIYSDSIVRFGLIDEILNQKHICNINIDKSVTDFFNSNYEFCSLTNEENQEYETPLAGYIGKQGNMLNFTYIFGVTKENKNAILGPYYYFTNFENASKEETANKKTKCGIVRFALFTKKIKYIENHPNDNIDESETKKLKLEDNLVDNQYERLTMRITDYDGKWAQNFDSCYLGDIELDNGEYVKNAPLLVLKEYNQQIPLSYHYVQSCKTVECEENTIV